MSGIIGIVNFDGAPVDRDLLRRMTSFMKFRGPDEQRIWVNGNVGFGHTLLRTTFEAEHEHQPFTLDGNTWIVADARVDAQDDLIAKLNAHGESVKRGAPDVELLLRSYRVWGEDCVHHLLGDFAFAIWDDVHRRLFCARDHLGVKPFFYADLGAVVLFSNTLDCIRQHPAISDRLDDLAIADFLLFDLNHDLASTVFADIRRLAPASRLIATPQKAATERYWRLPIDEPISFRKSTDYVERFNELLTIAVRDRTRTDRVGVFMSGGLDSTTLAAVASEQADVTAYTSIYDSSISDNERHYAGLAASYLGIPIHFRVMDDVVDELWQERSLRTPEPGSYQLNRNDELKYYRFLAKQGPVYFYGEGPDNALQYEWQPYLRHMVRQKDWLRLPKIIFQHTVAHRRIPLASVLRRPWTRKSQTIPAGFPVWLSESFASTLDLQGRWNAIRESATPAHPVRPEGHASFETPLWPALLEGMDSGVTQAAVELRHPFLDLPLLRYMLSVPGIPWCRRKYLIRQAMQGRLPQPVLNRPKTPFSNERLVHQTLAKAWSGLEPADQLLRYVDPKRLRIEKPENGAEFRLNLRPLVLNWWLRNPNNSSINLKQRSSHDEQGKIELVRQ